MSLTVLVKSASDLPNVERFSKSDPMCVITLEGKKKKTKVINNHLDPEWNESLQWSLQAALSGSEVLKVEVYDHETVGSNRLLGMMDLNLREVVSKRKQSVSSPLKSKEGQLMQSKINLELTYDAPAVSGTGGGGEDEDEDEDEAGGKWDIVKGEEKGVEMSGDEGGKEKREGVRGARHHRWKTKSASRAKLPNKPTDFQVRVHILEARKLIGGEVNPVVKVVCGKEIKKTSIQKGTSNPFWDEMLYYYFNEHPDIVFDKVVEIKVFNSKNPITKALIGTFKFDLGMVYDEQDHCFIHKWLLLTDPKDTAVEAKGYLKVSIQVVGPGDKPKHSPSEISPERVDIEANLLRPLGARLVPATLKIRIYRGEDFPQMDPGYFEKVKKFLHIGTVQKELVDPFCTVTFAGHKGRTEVIWNEQDPEWNEQINLGIRFPSMCERIRFQVKDKDKQNPDDFIGTCYLNMSQISVPGHKGRVLTFGPCFINIYGSPREYTDLPDKYDYLNRGLIEGVSYRGRVMVQVDMDLGTLPTNKHEDVKYSDQLRIKPFLHREKYKLFAAFFGASMVHPVDAPVEFEISIGNYGNKLDTNTPAQSSTTPPTNPVFDGTKYYFLPWMDQLQKPCCAVDSWWEDCTYRIESVNIILFTADCLEDDLEQVKKIMEVKGFKNDEAMRKLVKMLDDFMENLDQKLPALPDPEVSGKLFTLLDKLTLEHRTQELHNIRQDAWRLRRDSSVSLQDMVATCEEYIQRLHSLAVEPQNCVPDVIIWMLAGNKRVAVKRIPSHLLMYSKTAKAKARGKLCGKVQTIFLMPPAVEKEEGMEDLKDRAQLRVMLWLGLEEDQNKWNEQGPGGVVAIFAETYENECFTGSWEKTGLTRPHWSDSRGKIEQPMDAFKPPPGWKFDGKWFMSPELSQIAYEPDEGLDEWQEKLFETQTRLPLLHWPTETEKPSYWSDIRGDQLVAYHGHTKKALTRDDIKAPDGWIWITDWKIDKNRAVDGEGWEYSIEAGLGAWVPYERNTHLCRRRCWVRHRKRTKDSSAVEKRKRNKMMEEGWEYARLAHLTYHITEHHLDFARRRRWICKLVATDSGKPPIAPIFRFHGKKEKKKDAKQQVPRIYLTFKAADVHTYQLRAYIYQARDMYGSDYSDLSDPYAVIVFGHKSAKSRVVNESVCPIWDQTLIIKQLQFFGDPKNILESPPPVVIEFFDRDPIGQHEYLGTSTVFPTVRLSLDTPAPRLDWYRIERYTKYAGELLAAFELFLDEGGGLPITPLSSSDDTHYIVPSDIRPTLQKTMIEVLCWGVRDMKRYQLLKVNSPLVELECGGTVIRLKQHIEDASINPNFPDAVVTAVVCLPREELYAPPLSIRIFDKRNFGRLPLVGTHIIKSLKDFHVKPDLSAEQNAAVQAPPTKKKEVAITMDTDEDTHHMPQSDVSDSQKKSDFDWWTKYYYGIGDKDRTQKKYVDAGYDSIKIYDKELEEFFNHFTDLLQTFPLHRGKGSRDPEDPKSEAVGYFKGGVKMYELPQDDDSHSPRPIFFANLPSTDPIPVIVRVYIIKGIDLQPQDTNGKSDPFLKVKIGKTEINDKHNYIPSQTNPIFGKMFELPAVLPLDHTLTITVMDWDRGSAHDLIGETSIDLENRFLSHYRATCGLPESFSKRGVTMWRDRERPVQILEKWCREKSIADPKWSPDHKMVLIDGKEYSLDQFERTEKDHPDVGEPSAEKKKKIHPDVGEPSAEKTKKIHPDVGEPSAEKTKKIHPDVGEPRQRLALHFLRQQGLVPEHIETRNLYTPMHPKIPQGQLHMWVDIFPDDEKLPPPVDISPRKPERYVLRIVVWNTKDVLLKDTSITGEDMSDIYVKAWLRGDDEVQKTDVHYRSMDGEGNFNWRFVFPFEYIPPEQVMVIKKKEHFYSLAKAEKRLSPCLTLQIWDNDCFSLDDFIGTLDLNLHAMPEPATHTSFLDMLLEPELASSTSSQSSDQEEKRKPASSALCCCLAMQPKPASEEEDEVKPVDLFKKKRMKGWWPVYQGTELTGKVELEIEVVTEEEEKRHPAGKARDEPNMNPVLHPPNRPATSFLWFTSPWKTFKYIIWRHNKWRIIGVFVFILLVVIIIIFICTLPGTFGSWIGNRLLPG